MVVEVKIKHIVYGGRCCLTDPIALAMKELGCKRVRVTDRFITFFQGYVFKSYSTPPQVVKWMHERDIDEQIMKPLKFEL